MTVLSPIAVPGRPYTFTAKDAASTGEKGAGTFTQLHVSALPGQRFSFVAKDAVVDVAGIRGGLAGFIKKKQPKTVSSIDDFPKIAAEEIQQAIDEEVQLTLDSESFKAEIQAQEIKERRLIPPPELFDIAELRARIQMELILQQFEDMKAALLIMIDGDRLI